VLVIVKPEFVLQTVIDACRKRPKVIVIITAGLGESSARGKEIEREILEVAAGTGTAIIGPNCSGLFNARADLNLLGVPGISKGPLSIIAQSGNVIDSLVAFSKQRKIGFSKIISAGNSIGLKSHNYLRILQRTIERVA